MARERNRRIFLAAGTGILQRTIQAGTTLLIMPLVLAALGPSRFGIWGAVTSLAWFHGLLDLGMGGALVTHVARVDALDRTAEVRRLVVGALGLGCGLAVLWTAAGAAVVGSAVHGPKAGLYLIAIVAMGLNIPLNTANSTWMGLQKGYVSGLWDLAQTLATAAGLIVAATCSRDVRVYVGVVYAALVLSNAGSLIQLFRVRPEIRRGGLKGLGTAMREIAGQGMSYFVLALACALTYLLDNVLALELLGPQAAARMAIAMRICMTAWGVLEVMSLPLWPAFSEAGVKADWRWVRRSMLRGTTLLVGTAAAGALVLVTAGKPLLGLWLRTDLGIDRGLLAAIAAWVLAQAVNRVPNVFLNATSVVGFQVAVNAAATAAAFVLKFVLAARFGVAGILWATTATTLLIVVPANLWRIARWHRRSRQAAAPEAVGSGEPAELLAKGVRA